MGVKLAIGVYDQFSQLLLFLLPVITFVLATLKFPLLC